MGGIYRYLHSSFETNVSTLTGLVDIDTWIIGAENWAQNNKNLYCYCYCYSVWNTGETGDIYEVEEIQVIRYHYFVSTLRGRYSTNFD